MIFDKKVQIPLKNKNNFIQGDYMKKWKDSDEVIKMIHDLGSHKLRQKDKEMSNKSKFDKYKKKEGKC